MDPVSGVNTPNVEITAANDTTDTAAELEQAIDTKDALADAAEEKAAGNDDQFASKFAALTRKEKELRQRQQEVESKYSEYEAWKAEQAEKEANKEPEMSFEDKLLRNPLEALAEKGFSYEKLTQLALNDGKLPPEMQMEVMKREIQSEYQKKLDAIENKLAERDKKEEEEKYNQTVNGFISELTEFVNNDESYELIRANDSVEMVYDLIQDHYNQTGEILSNKEAADTLESHLNEELSKMLEKAAPKFGYTKAQLDKAKTEITAQSPTLSNSQTSHVSTNGSKPLSDDESKQLAAQQLKWID